MKELYFKTHFRSAASVSLFCGRDPGRISALAPRLFSDAGKVCLVTDRDAFKIFKNRIYGSLGSLAANTCAFHTTGENAKNFRTLEKLLGFMLKNGCSRRSLVIAAGGGSVTDLAGLAAGLYMRGVNWISMPTTLLGQIDAGIGGKTAVNIRGVKNIAGLFNQPVLTVCDTAFLDTLSEKELLAGAGELVKYALIAPGNLGRIISKHLPGALNGNKDDLAAVVSACAAFKLDLVSKDEREETGLRETLNLGHTAAHAFEALSGGRLPHGEAVLWGLRYSAMLSYELGIMDRKYARAAQTALQLIEPSPLPAACLNFRGFKKFISRDKKTGNRSNRFILIVRPGILKGINDIPDTVLRTTLTELGKAI